MKINRIGNNFEMNGCCLKTVNESLMDGISKQIFTELDLLRFLEKLFSFKSHVILFSKDDQEKELMFRKPFIKLSPEVAV